MPRDRFFNVKMFKGSLGPSREVYPVEDEEEKGSAGETETPLLDIYEEPGAIVIEADLPGIDPKEVAVYLASHQVMIEGRRCRRGEGQEEGNYLRMERCIEDFRRIIPLPFAVNPQKAEALYRQGVLILRFPRIEERRNRTIRIEIR